MNATVDTPAISPVEQEVRRIHGLVRSHDYAGALLAAKVLARQVPDNRDVLYMTATSQRYLGKIPDALATLEHLQREHPGFSRLYQERGQCHVALRDAPRAVEAFLTAVNINPALPASWGMLEGLYKMTGDAANAATAAAHVATLKRLPAEVITATSLFSDGDWGPAEQIIRAFLLQHGDHVEGMRLLARIGLAREVFDDAELLLEGVLKLAPDYRAARFDYARVLLERHKYLEAQRELDELLKLEPHNRLYKTNHATASVGLGKHEAAASRYRELLVDAPSAAELHLSLAHCLKTLGQLDAAIVEYRAAIIARPTFGDAYWSLANLKTYRFQEAEMDAMRREEAAPTTPPVDRYHLCFALGKAFEDRREYETSWHCYERGNGLKRAESRYRPEPIERNTRLQMEVCTTEFFASRRGWGSAAAAPIFILGLPRAGSTLIEQILASHSLVEGTQELAEIPRIALDLQGRDPDMANPRYPRVLADMKREDFLQLGEKYLKDTRVFRSNTGPAIPYFIDKMPNNFRHIGLIRLMLPNAKIIDARREPMACCFSNLKQLFASGQEFTYSIDDIARYYRTYLELMAHWNAVLPGWILRVEHEAVVDDLEANVRRILDFCGLEFEPACIEFHKTERSVRTPSSEQVRRPIFREGLDQWRNFEPWLGPLKEALGDARDRYRN